MHCLTRHLGEQVPSGNDDEAKFPAEREADSEGAHDADQGHLPGCCRPRAGLRRHPAPLRGQHQHARGAPAQTGWHEGPRKADHSSSGGKVAEEHDKQVFLLLKPAEKHILVKS